MALVKWGSSKKKQENVPSPDSFDTSINDALKTEVPTTVISSFSYFNSLSQFYCKRIIIEKSQGQDAPATRVETAVYGCAPNPSMYTFSSPHNGMAPYQSLCLDNSVHQSRSRRKSSHTSKLRAEHKCSKKKNGKIDFTHEKKLKAFYIKVTCGMIFGFSLLLWWFSTLFWCQAKPLDFVALETSLKSEVIGQEEVLTSLMLNFYRTSTSKNQHPVILLSGSTGVGKSLISDLIVNNFPGSGHSELLFYPAPPPEIVVKKLKSCEQNILILDSLYFIDSNDIAEWARSVQNEASSRGKQTWILVVFTTEHWAPEVAVATDAEFLKEISTISHNLEEIFIRHGLDTELITFNPMETHHIRDCVRRELEKLSLLADENQLEDIVNELTNTAELRRQGCKHVKKYFLRSDYGLLKSN